MQDTLTRDVIDYKALEAATLQHDPYDFFVVPGFLPREVALAAAAAFPGPDLPGVLPAPANPKQDAFGDVIRALKEPRLSEAFGDKYGLALEVDHMMITLRARTRPVDGKIHTDSETKVVTALIYLNDGWDSPGGRLRVLRSENIDDMVAEVPPMAGTLLSFRRSNNSWHGHLPFDGVRKAIMFNWMVDQATARRELRRHAVSAGFKSLFH